MPSQQILLPKRSELGMVVHVYNLGALRVTVSRGYKAGPVSKLFLHNVYVDILRVSYWHFETNDI